MNRTRLLFALCSLALIAATAPASAALSTLPFRGLLYQSTGACVVDRAADGSLLLSNIGSSGQDGVSFSCLNMDGAVLAHGR